MNTLHKWNKYNGNVYKFYSVPAVQSKGYNSKPEELLTSLYGYTDCNYVLYDPCISIDFNQ